MQSATHRSAESTLDRDQFTRPTRRNGQQPSRDAELVRAVQIKLPTNFSNNLTTIIMNELIIPVIIGLVQVVKIAGLSSRRTPLLAVVFGVVFSFVMPDGDWLMGAVYGLSAVGLYNSTQVLTGKN